MSSFPKSRVAFAVVLAAVVAFHAWDHVAWVDQDVLAELDSDSTLHGGIMAGRWATLGDGPLLPKLYEPGTYPPLVHWVAWLCFAFGEPSVHLMRQSQGVFAGVLALGCGLLAGRVWGRPAGIAAAALCFTFPTFYAQRSLVMLALAEAAFLGLAYALLPSPLEPARGRPAHARHVFGGVAMGLASLTHVSMLYWLAGTGVTQVAMAAWGWFRGHEGAKLHARDLVVYYGFTALVGAGWYLRSAGFLVDALDNNYDIVTWEQDRIDIVLFLGWIKTKFMLAPAAWSALVGLCALPWLARGRPLLLPIFIGMIAGYFGVLSYPHVHARYFLPLVPMVLVLVTAPIGLLLREGPLAAPRKVAAWALALGLSAWGLHFSASWRWAEPGPRTADARYDGAIDLARLIQTRDRAWAQLVTRPTRWLLHAPLPHRGVLPVDSVIDGVIEALALRPAPPGSDFGPARDAPVLAMLWRYGEGVFGFEFVARGLLPPRMVERLTPDHEVARIDCARDTCYALYIAPATPPAGIEPVRTWDVRIRDGGPDALVLGRVTTDLAPLRRQFGPAGSVPPPGQAGGPR